MTLDEYEKFGRGLYESFTLVVSMLLRTRIREDAGFRLQQIQPRAKTVESLRTRLSEINEIETKNIENHRKDLAGCRIVFYTNHDVNRFTNSGILTSLFDVDWNRSRVHHPKPKEESASELFQSINYVVKLKEDRTLLSEYSDFSGLFCEVQVQTVLNHAWAEMAHDTIYKRPDSLGFGSQEMEQIEKRLKEVMQHHLLPAGYLFQRIASDVQRLVEGKTLFESRTVDAILDASNNNERHTALVRLKENVLPIYDDLGTVYPEILEQLKEAWGRAERTETMPFEGTVGKISGYEPNHVTAKIAEIITQYRYITPEQTYTTIRDLYIETSNNESHIELLKVAEELAKHDLKIWERFGPAIPVILAKELEKEEDIHAFAPLAITISSAILDSKVDGATAHSDSVTLSRGTVAHSEDLENARRTVINVIADFATCVIADDKLFCDAIDCLMLAGQLPHNRTASSELVAMIYRDLAYVIERIAHVVIDLSLNCRQSVESKLLQAWRVNKSVLHGLNSSPNVVNAHKQFIESAIELRTTLNKDEEFVAFKTIVGYQCVLPHMWEGESKDWRRDQDVRSAEQEKLVLQIGKENWTTWKSRLASAANLQSRDMMTFPPFLEFLSILGKRQPDLVLDLLRDRDSLPPRMIGPVAVRLLDMGEQSEVEVLLNEWLDAEQLIPEVAATIAHSKNVEESTIERTVRIAIDTENQEACVRLLQGAVAHFGENPSFWREQVFFPCLEALNQESVQIWMHESWYMVNEDSIFADFTETQAISLLDTMIEIPQIDSEVESFLGVISSKHHRPVLDWLGKRLKHATKVSSMGYDPIPYSFHEMHRELQKHTEDVIGALREWWESDDSVSLWEVSYFLSKIYPNLEDPLISELLTIVLDGSDEDLVFITSSLRGFSGREELLPLLREILASEVVNEELEDMIHSVIRETGIVSGAFGFAQTYQAKADMLRPWLEDGNARVVAFAKSEIHGFEQEVANENRRVSEQIAMRKLDYDEPLVDRDPPDDNEK